MVAFLFFIFFIFLGSFLFSFPFELVVDRSVIEIIFPIFVYDGRIFQADFIREYLGPVIRMTTPT